MMGFAVHGAFFLSFLVALIPVDNLALTLAPAGALIRICIRLMAADYNSFTHERFCVNAT